MTKSLFPLPQEEDPQEEEQRRSSIAEDTELRIKPHQKGLFSDAPPRKRKMWIKPTKEEGGVKIVVRMPKRDFPDTKKP